MPQGRLAGRRARASRRRGRVPMCPSWSASTSTSGGAAHLATVGFEERHRGPRRARPRSVGRPSGSGCTSREKKTLVPTASQRASIARGRVGHGQPVRVLHAELHATRSRVHGRRAAVKEASNRRRGALRGADTTWIEMGISLDRQVDRSSLWMLAFLRRRRSGVAHGVHRATRRADASASQKTAQPPSVRERIPA